LNKPLFRSKAIALRAVKLAHTVVWAFFVVCILAIPVAAWRGDQRTAGWLVGVVAVEVAVLLVNRMRCPLTSLARRYTDDRRENFDICLPIWLARHNQQIFGTLYVGGTLYALFRWLSA
jgi:hypothetical protein